MSGVAHVSFISPYRFKLIREQKYVIDMADGKS